jgi:RNA polymerase sigma-70 factor, ECF subfamily
MDEATLIAAARLGDEDAFSALYHQHAAYVRAIGRSVLHKTDLDDMCQDTFLLAFTRLHSFEGTCQFRTWITRIAMNQCLLILRRARQTKNGESNLIQLDDELAEEDILHRCIFTSEDKELEGVPVRLDLHRMLDVLTPAQRRILTMAYLEDIPDLEIAKRLGTSLSAVKGAIHLAKRRLQKINDQP